MIFTKSNGIMTATLLLSLSATVSTFAQQIPESPGIVRITDRPISAGQPIEQTSAFGHHLRHQPTRQIYVDGSTAMNAGNATGGPTGNCPSGDQYVNGQSGGACPSGQCPHCRGSWCRGAHGCHFCEYYCKHSPGYGYAPPSKYPLLRRGVEYTNYYPATWYGAGADYSHSTAPMVYQPTDTTQLGFYYQHVPFWQPQPNMLPERPIPAQWNIRAPAIQASGWYGGGGSYSGYGNTGFLSQHHGMRNYSSGYNGTGSCPVDGRMSNQGSSPQVVVPPAQPTPKPAGPDSPETLPMDPDSEPNALPPTTSVPPSPGGSDKQSLPTNSATSGHIRRIGFRF